MPWTPCRRKEVNAMPEVRRELDGLRCLDDVALFLVHDAFELGDAFPAPRAASTCH
jgi:hypothetical protein